ncbi:MAG: hypothetical protein AB7G75_27815 [Candidatus Binatia bacterium]
MSILQAFRNLFRLGVGNVPPSANIRAVMRQAYLEHRQGSSLPAGTPPHRAGLHGALGVYYRSRGLPVRELSLWAELTPFLLMTEEVGSEALIEYVLFLESPKEARVPWLLSTISTVLRRPAPSQDSQRVMAPLALLKNVAWCQLLEPDVRRLLEEESQILAAALNDRNLPPLEE